MDLGWRARPAGRGRGSTPAILGALGVAAGLSASAPACADSFSFGDYFFPGDVAANGFGSVTDQGTPYTVSGPGDGFQFLSQGGRSPIGWDGQFKPLVLVLYDDGAPGPVTIGFRSPVDGITGLAAQPFATGPYIATIEAFSGGVLIQSDSYASDNQPGPQGSIPYFRLNATGITSIVISTTNDGAGIGIGSDNPGIPEPSAWALMMLGLGAIGALSRRRRRLASGTGLA
jgi:hypothetical protein